MASSVSGPEAMHLLALGLYSHDGELRALRFRPGKLNVISGFSRTGKTELVKIIDYCAGRKTPFFAVGPITHKVAWFAAVFAAPDGRRVLVARPQPKGESSTVAMIAFGAGVDLPASGTELRTNATSASVRGALDGLLGLGSYDIDQYGPNRDRLRASVSHAIQFCLQAQTELISPEHLFHRGGDDDVARDFEDLFPYFLGAVDEDLIAAKRRAAELRRKIRSLSAEVQRIEARAELDTTRDRALVSEAVRLGMAKPAASDGDPRGVLKSIVDRTSPRRPAPSTSTSALVSLREDVAVARSALRLLRERRASIEVVGSERGAHSQQLDIQLGRLGIIDSLGESEHDPTSCIVCGSTLDKSDPTVDSLGSDLRELQGQLEVLQSASQDLTAAERELDQAIEKAQGDLVDAVERAKVAAEADAADRELAFEFERQAFLRGVIAEHLRLASSTSADSLAMRRAELGQLEEELRAVEPGTTNSAIREEVDARLDAVAQEMTDMARDLDLEAADQGLVRIDQKTLNVVIGTARGPVHLRQMGAGANHVGYHLVAHLALHGHFRRERRPVPRFLMIDQPSLPFFPAQARGNLDAAVGDVDWEEVKRMFVVTQRQVEAAGGDFQAFITDHASFPDEDWYEDALVEDWHSGKKLVPEHWPEGS